MHTLDTISSCVESLAQKHSSYGFYGVRGMDY